MVKADGSKKISKEQHRINLSVLFGNRAFWLVCIFNIAMMGYLWGLNKLDSDLLDGSQRF